MTPEEWGRKGGLATEAISAFKDAVSSPGRGDSDKQDGRGGDYSLSAGGIGI